jgi:heat shock protein HslJ
LKGTLFIEATAFLLKISIRRKIMKFLAFSILLVLTFALAACGGTNEIVGTTWQWEEYQDMAGENNITVSDPENYTLTLNKDGTASIQADCNQVTWQYELDGSQFIFDTTGPATLAMCAEDSLDQLFLERLSNTATYVLSDGKLFLNLQYDSGNMVFHAE